MRILTTGADSGLGKFVHRTFGGFAWTRNTTAEQKEVIKREGVDVIVHCAFNSQQKVTSATLYDYFTDNVALTADLTGIPHRKFVFISSVDVYPRTGSDCSETAVVDVNSISTFYGVTKLMSESVVHARCPNHLILRCTTLLGRDARKNSLIRILDDSPCVLTLAADSRFNYLLHVDVAGFISHCIDNKLGGIYNIASASSVTLAEIAEMANKQVQFGSFRYDVGQVDNRKAANAFPAFKKASLDVIKQFISIRNKTP
jgi:nucleoside-diphosphate-sugar epimerase